MRRQRDDCFAPGRSRLLMIASATSRSLARSALRRPCARVRAVGVDRLCMGRNPNPARPTWAPLSAIGATAAVNGSGLWQAAAHRRQCGSRDGGSVAISAVVRIGAGRSDEVSCRGRSLVLIAEASNGDLDEHEAE